MNGGRRHSCRSKPRDFTARLLSPAAGHLCDGQASTTGNDQRNRKYFMEELNNDEMDD